MMTYFWHAYAYADVAVRKPALLLMERSKSQAKRSLQMAHGESIDAYYTGTALFGRAVID